MSCDFRIQCRTFHLNRRLETDRERIGFQNQTSIGCSLLTSHRILHVQGLLRLSMTLKQMQTHSMA